MKNNDTVILKVEDDGIFCHCGKQMIQYMSTFLCPSCDQVQIRDMTWCKQHIEGEKEI